MKHSDRQREIETLLTGAAQFLIWLRDKDSVSIGQARRELGTKVYNYAYKLAILGLVYIDENNIIKLTDKGKKLVNCIINCFMIQKA